MGACRLLRGCGHRMKRADEYDVDLNKVLNL